MKLTPLKMSTFWISVVLAALGLIGSFVSIPFVSAFAYRSFCVTKLFSRVGC
jgi:hypothetical protein